MKIFISWSGQLSKHVAEALRDWLPSVIQAVIPYVSSEDIDKGARWSADISKELSESNFGILCVTSQNIKAPWLNFEAGALSKSFEKSNVSPFLFRIERSDVTGPLLQFQSTIYERNDVLKLVRSINDECEVSLDLKRLEQIFDVWWPKLEEALDELKDTSSVSVGVKRSSEEMIHEVLELVRAQQKTLTSPEELFPPEYLAWVMNQYAHRANIDLLEDLIATVHRLRRLLGDMPEETQQLKDFFRLCEQFDVIARELTHPLSGKGRRIVRRSMQARPQVKMGEVQEG
ncbi:TIR domain-containing protein [Streptosporangium sp. NPDC005286]|uniref:TIR domain-containing protein n=1 Tax=Streptosporangium sp. NPDC005286 TaxID=3154463 RepID=UPI0033BCCAE2